MQNVTLHLKAIFNKGELQESATCKDYFLIETIQVLVLGRHHERSANGEGG